MSVESAKEFLAKMKGDAEFFAKFEKLGSNEERQKLAQSLGYEFTKEEFLGCAANDAELTDADLEMVAGGKSAAWIAAVGTCIGAGAAAAA